MCLIGAYLSSSRLYWSGHEHRDTASEHSLHGNLPTTPVLPTPTIGRCRDDRTFKQAVVGRLQGCDGHARAEDGHARGSDACWVLETYYLFLDFVKNRYIIF